MEESYQRMKQLFQLSRDAVLGAENGTVVFANPSADRFWGKTAEGASISELFPPDFSPEAESGSICSMRINQKLASVSVSREGNLTLICVSPAPDSDRAAIDFSPAMPALNSSMHDLRASARWLLETVDLTSERANATASILMHSCFIALRALNNINTLQQLSDGSIPFSPVWSDLSAFLGELLCSVESLVSRLELHVVFRTSGKDFGACVDEKLLEQLVLNLLCNCLQHMERGNTATVSLKVENGRVYLSVDDDGSGMDEQTISGLLQALGGEPSLENYSFGAGLGLYIARGIVDRHGGNLIVASQPGEGSSVRIVFPRGEPPAPRFSGAQAVYKNWNPENMLRELSAVLPYGFYQPNYLD